MTEQGDLIRHQPHLKERASNEFKRFLVIFLYLWAVFGFLSIHKSFVLSQPLGLSGACLCVYQCVCLRKGSAFR
jgi:hypothetical protein